MITTILFDLDGTLLPMDQDVFIQTYSQKISKKAAPYGYDPKVLVDTIWKGTAAMVRNNGQQTNETVFWSVFAQVYGEEALKDKAMFDSFYENEFNQVQTVCGFQPKIPALIAKLKAADIRLVLATNPVFPQVATNHRIHWARLEPQDFVLYTTYENASYCKPNPAYYREILDTLHLFAEECIMVGNDVTEDMVAERLEMQVFLLTDCLINKNNTDISQYPHGDGDALTKYITQVCRFTD